MTVEKTSEPGLVGGPSLLEHEDLVNPEAELTGSELFSNLRSGVGRASGGGPAHGYDDHRADHQDEIKRRFARRVSGEIVDFAEQHGVERVVLVADPRMLGFLRPKLGALVSQGIALDELARDLSRHPELDIQEALAEEGLVPRRHAPIGAYRPRGQPWKPLGW